MASRLSITASGRQRSRSSTRTTTFSIPCLSCSSAMRLANSAWKPCIVAGSTSGSSGGATKLSTSAVMPLTSWPTMPQPASIGTVASPFSSEAAIFPNRTRPMSRRIFSPSPVSSPMRSLSSVSTVSTSVERKCSALSNSHGSTRTAMTLPG